jgi:hypothetical protein
MESKLVRCKACSHEFRIEYLKRCPSCRAKINIWDFAKSVDVIAPAGTAPESRRPKIEKLGKAEAALSTRSAEERTTHAVRSIAIFILIQVTASVISAILAGIGLAIDISSGDSSGGGAAMYILAIVTLLIGLFASLNAAWSEYSKSS